MFAEQVEEEKPSLPVPSLACQLEQVSGRRALLCQRGDGLCVCRLVYLGGHDICQLSFSLS